MLTGVFYCHKLALSLLPDVAYQPSLCAVAEGGPKCWSQFRQIFRASGVEGGFLTISPLAEKLFLRPYKTKLSTEKKGGVIRQGYLTVRQS